MLSDTATVLPDPAAALPGAGAAIRGTGVGLGEAGAAAAAAAAAGLAGVWSRTPGALRMREAFATGRMNGLSSHSRLDSSQVLFQTLCTWGGCGGVGGEADTVTSSESKAGKGGCDRMSHDTGKGV